MFITIQLKTHPLRYCMYCLVIVVTVLITCRHFEDRGVSPVNSADLVQHQGGQNRTDAIPMIIHFIWNDEILPTEFVGNIKGFLRNNPVPRWEYYFWTKASGLNYIKDKYSVFYKRASTENDESRFIRADLLRLLVLHEYGGFYFDLDTVSVQSLDSYAASHTCSLVLEPGEHYFMWNVDILISNAALTCVPQHPFYKLAISKLSQQGQNCNSAFECTGPYFITKLFREENQTSKTRRHLPDLQSSEVFQDVYDVHNDKLLKQNCLNTTHLHPKKVAICTEWRARGMEQRELSPKALTYHTWYHTNRNPVSLSKDNVIYNIIPNVKIYGRNLHK